MKKFFLIMIIVSIVTIPVLSQAGGTPSSDYTIALMKKSNGEKIKAFKGYVKKYPATTNKYTKFAYYWLSICYYDEKQFANVIKNGLKSEKLGGIEDDMKAKLFFVIGRSYASKGSLFNKNNAISYLNKAIKIADLKKLKQIASNAKKIKKKLSTKPKPSETPSQKIVRLYNDEDYDGVISTYSSLNSTLKSDKKLHTIYSTSLFKNENFKKAIIEYKKIYSSEKKGKNAKKIADCNSGLAKKYRRSKASYLKEAIKYYIESGILYGREGNKANKKNALLLAKNMIYDKYNLKAKIAKYNKGIKSSSTMSSKNKAAIKKAERELKKFKRYLRKEYTDNSMTPPAYEMKKKTKLEKAIKTLKSGGGSKTSGNSGAALTAEIKKADAELEILIKTAKAKL